MENWSSKIQPASADLFYSRNPESDPRLGDIVLPFDPAVHQLKDFRYALIGFPEDRGIKKNHGHPGASLGPNEIRRAFYRLTAKDLYHAIDLREARLIDLGNIKKMATVEEGQQALGEVVQACLFANLFPIVLGGGHETAYGHFLGYKGFMEREKQAVLSLHVLNIDAHLDVRPLEKGEGHSGSPFRQMMEQIDYPLKGEHLTVFGLQGSCNAENDLKYARGKGVQIHWLEDLKKGEMLQDLKQLLAEKRRPFYTTICLDSMRGAEFPATSAAPTSGFKVREMLGLLEVIASHSALMSLDLVEYSPPYDFHGGCAKIVAQLLYRFLVHRLKLLPKT
ncbi:MAG: formimidoylglutamase [Deltaproteobacteria bacterium]|nr:formimidoylglutamase [Deltaproteobacteria bacterium]